MIDSLLAYWWVWAIPLAFLAVVIYVLNPKRKKEFEQEARVPLEDDRSPK